MSSCRNIKFRTTLGLATLGAVQTSISARHTSSNSHSRNPVPSQNKFSSTVVPQAQSSILSHNAVTPPKASSSMPKKTESSIIKHVERLRKARDAQAIFKTATATKPKVAVSKIAQSQPAPKPHVPSIVSSTPLSVTRSDASIDKHIKRITSTREKRKPMTSPRFSPVTSQRVSSLQTVKSANIVDPAQIADQLSALNVAPLAVRRTSPKVPIPALRSCLKTVASAVDKHVRFEECGEWNIHRLRPFQKDSAPNTFLSLAEAILIQPTPYVVRDGKLLEEGRPSRNLGLCHPGHYRLHGARELRWPPPENDFDVKDCSLLPRCLACAQQASMGSPLIRYLPGMISVWCSDCLSDSSRRLEFSPPLDHNGEEDELDTCREGEHNNGGSCHYGYYATKAFVHWLYANYPERYPGFEAYLNG